MGTARVMVSLAAMGVAAGAYLAVATIPAIAPYLQERRPAPIILAGPENSAGQLATRPESMPDDGFSIRPGPVDGSLAIDLPEWTGRPLALMDMGRRVMDEWRSWTGRAEEPQAYDQSDDRRPEFREEPRLEQGYGYRERWRQRQEPYGYVQRDDPRDYYGSDEERDYGYGRWSSPPEEPAYSTSEAFTRRLAPRAQEPSANPPGSAADLGQDAAALAAQRAREAARDVRAAENALP